MKIATCDEIYIKKKLRQEIHQLSESRAWSCAPQRPNHMCTVLAEVPFNTLI